MVQLRFWNAVVGGIEKVNLLLTLGLQEGEKMASRNSQKFRLSYDKTDEMQGRDTAL